ncbi:hypothetical protein DI487_00140 [Flavobacterium sediminis]|uniref:Kazal-like domain-containing protein n=1 Tax=Flavobacterium sediminis TaxID=2201181 RepID=A0A2U8QQV7_9FLAO|nr:hypothetical protein [Flavobacterium sediminis]AWM12441.1 hypothetical protein DI487_00140 [Flavobacterium sediminis]
MKQKLKKILFLTLFSILFFSFTNCEYDEKVNLTDNSNLHEKHFNVRPIGFEELSLNKKLINNLSEISESISQSIDGKIVYSAENDFYIDTDFATYIEDDNGYHSYTFRIISDSAEYPLENLILSLNDSLGYDMYVALYDVTSDEILQLQEGNAINLSQKCTLLRVNNNTINTSSIFGKAYYDALEAPCLLDVNFVPGSVCGCDGHSYGEFCTCFSSPATPDQWVETWGACPDGSSGDNSSSGGGGSVNTSPTTTLASPCKKVKNLNNKVSQLKQALINLKATTSQNHENGIFCDVDASSSNSNSIQNIPSENSSGGQINPDMSPSKKYIMIAHTHDSQGSTGNGTYSIFSWDDLATISKLTKDGHIKTSEFVFYAITADNTQYAITIDDSTKLNAFFNSISGSVGTYVNGQDLIEKDKIFKKYYNSPNGIKVDSNPVDDKTKFLKFLKEADCGLTLFEIDNNFENYTKLSLDSNGQTKSENCN